jgi:hypothetical protein
MDAANSPFPDDVEALKALLAVALERADEAEARAANAEARASAMEALIAHLKLQISGVSSWVRVPSAAVASSSRWSWSSLTSRRMPARTTLLRKPLRQKTSNVVAFERKRPARKPLPEYLLRERVVVPAPCSCPACGSTRLSKLGEDVTETLEVIPRAWKVV